jgi:hypothetical protein
MKLEISLHSTSKQVIIITIISVLLAGIFYIYRTTYLELSPLQDNLFRTIRMTLVYVLLPFGWAFFYKRVAWSELGITKKQIFYSIALGICVYSIALIAFLISLGNPEFDQYFRWGSDYALSEWLIIISLVCWMAFVTDMFSHGFVLMLLTKYQTIWFAVLVQNIVWLGIHLYEISILSPSMTLFGAVGLTITLGVCGDLVVIKTKNIIGLGIGHMFLNIAFFSYVRFIG